jgi:RNase P protein component
LFAAFVVREPDADGPRIGFTIPRAVGKAVVRNRIRRRVREAVRFHLDRLNPQWSIVINPRRKAFDAPIGLHARGRRALRRRQGTLDGTAPAGAVSSVSARRVRPRPVTRELRIF